MNKIKRAFWTSFPIAFGYISLGFIGGALIQKSGFNVLDVFLLSVLVFSGSAVFISANMLAAGIYPQISLYVAITIIVTSLRNIMYSSSLANDVKDLKGWRKIVFAQYVTDETFAINKMMFEGSSDWDSDLALYVNIFACVYGLIGNILGCVFGQVVNIPIDLGFFMMSSMFIVLTVLRIKDKADAIMLLISIVISFAVLSIYQGGLDLVIIALIVTTIGYFLDKKYKSNSGRMCDNDE